MSANVLSELGELHLSRPSVDAPVDVVAGWYAAKAVVLDHLHAGEQADAARAHARRLLADNSLIGGQPGQGKGAPGRLLAATCESGREVTPARRSRTAKNVLAAPGFPTSHETTWKEDL